MKLLFFPELSFDVQQKYSNVNWKLINKLYIWMYMNTHKTIGPLTLLKWDFK